MFQVIVAYTVLQQQQISWVDSLGWSLIGHLVKTARPIFYCPDNVGHPGQWPSGEWWYWLIQTYFMLSKQTNRGQFSKNGIIIIYVADYLSPLSLSHAVEQNHDINWKEAWVLTPLKTTTEHTISEKRYIYARLPRPWTETRGQTNSVTL